MALIPGLPQSNIFGTGAVNPVSRTMSAITPPVRTGGIGSIGTGTKNTGVVNTGKYPSKVAGIVAAPKPKPIVPPPSKPKPAPKPHPKSPLEKWLAGDTTYQQQLAEFNKSRADETTDYNNQIGTTNRDYQNTQRQLNLQGQRDRMDQQNDFAGRGILHSGVYAKSLGDYNTDFNTKVNNLITGKTDKLGDLGTQRNSFLRELQLQMNSAKQDAIRRRAQTLGL